MKTADFRTNVFLVGAGPGDPGLLTRKGFDLLADAEVIFYDNLVNPKILEFAHPDALKIDVGKRGEGSRTEQSLIEDWIVREAKAGKRVVRLKGGDPFIFGRGGEEAERLVQENIPFEVVPGVTSAIAVPAYAGIPLTHRDFTSTVLFLTGHLQDSSLSDEENFREIDWQAAAKMGTLVFVMGVKTIRQNMEKLMEAGRDFSTPVALVRWGTYPFQQTWLSTVGEIADLVDREKIMPPAVLVVGESVRLREQLNWFEQKPLFGKRILVTRTRERSTGLVRLLERTGGEVLECPVMEVLPPLSFETLDQEVKKISEYDWLLFTSVHAVDFFFQRLFQAGQDVRCLSHLQIGAVGKMTGQELFKFGLKADLIPSEFYAENLAKELILSGVRNKKILVPQAEDGHFDWIQNLTDAGAIVKRVVSYRKTVSEKTLSRFEFFLKKKKPDLLTFTSASTAIYLKQILEKSSSNSWMDIPAVCMGKRTAEEARKQGFKIIGVAQQLSVEGLVEEILRHSA